MMHRTLNVLVWLVVAGVAQAGCAQPGGGDAAVDPGASPTLGAGVPEGGVVLFDGEGVDAWADGARVTEDGLLRAGAVTRGAYRDFELHVEFRVPTAAENGGDGNSGIYLLDRYEVQVLDSFGDPPRPRGCGGLYGVRAPTVNASRPAGAWQTYDIAFTAPRFGADGEKVADARVTVRHNGVLVQDDVALARGTGQRGNARESARGPIVLQDHGDPVMYRNVWLVEQAAGDE